MVKDLVGGNVNIQQLQEQRDFYILHEICKLSYKIIAEKKKVVESKFNLEKFKDMLAWDQNRKLIEYARTRVISYKTRVERSIRLH